MIILPIYQNYKFHYEIMLDDVTYSFEFSWSVLNKTFLVSMKKLDSEYIFRKLALVPGIDLLKTSGIGELGKLRLIDTQDNNEQDPVSIEDFNHRYALVYMSIEEL